MIRGIGLVATLAVCLGTPAARSAGFEAASLRASKAPGGRGSMTVDAKRLTYANVSVRDCIMSAWNVKAYQVEGPDWLTTDRYDLAAAAATPVEEDALLADRLKLKWHTEDRPMDAYTLLAVKPKMKKADPASRSHCIRSNAPAGSPPGSTMLTCQNITMDDFADQLMNAGTGSAWPVQNSTGLEGGWDFALTYGRGPGPMMAGAQAGGAEGRGRAVAEASDPGGTLTIFEAVEKQLGLKLEMQKRPEPVIVIDHLDEKPSGN